MRRAVSSRSRRATAAAASHRPAAGRVLVERNADLPLLAGDHAGQVVARSTHHGVVLQHDQPQPFAPCALFDDLDGLQRAPGSIGFLEPLRPRVLALGPVPGVGVRTRQPVGERSTGSAVDVIQRASHPRGIHHPAKAQFAALQAFAGEHADESVGSGRGVRAVAHRHRAATGRVPRVISVAQADGSRGAGTAAASGSMPRSGSNRRAEHLGSDTQPSSPPDVQAVTACQSRHAA